MASTLSEREGWERGGGEEKSILQLKLLGLHTPHPLPPTVDEKWIGIAGETVSPLWLRYPLLQIAKGAVRRANVLYYLPG